MSRVVLDRIGPAKSTLLRGLRAECGGETRSQDSGAMYRYVILEHSHHGIHWDFMLERGGVLSTWRLDSAPCHGGRIAAASLPDHRRHYLDYEGPIGGDRGFVTRWDGGNFEWQVDEPDRVDVLLTGTRLHGRASLHRSQESGWVFEFHETPPGSLT